MNITLLATDQQRSVIQAIDRRSSGSIAYTPYGYHCKKSTSMCRLGFNGELPEASTGDYLLGNGYRAFNPVLMRFNSPDKLSPFGKGGVNTYAYCLGDPINRSDPTGNTPWYNWTSRQVYKFSKISREVGIPIFPGTSHVSSNHVPRDMPRNLPGRPMHNLPAKKLKLSHEPRTLEQLSFEMLAKQGPMPDHPVVNKSVQNLYANNMPELNKVFSLVVGASDRFSDFKAHVYKHESVLLELKAGFRDQTMLSPYTYRLDARNVRGNYNFDSDSS